MADITDRNQLIVKVDATSDSQQEVIEKLAEGWIECKNLSITLYLQRNAARRSAKAWATSARNWRKGYRADFPPLRTSRHLKR